MFKSLVIGWAEEDHNFKFFPCKPVVHNFISKPLVAKFVQLLANAVNGLTLERCCVTLIAIKTCDLREDTLNQMAYSHAGGDSVGIHNHVGGNALNREWQILLSVSHAACSFLAMARGEFIADLWDLNSSHFNFDKSLFLLICSENNLIDVAFF